MEFKYETKEYVTGSKSSTIGRIYQDGDKIYVRYFKINRKSVKEWLNMKPSTEWAFDSIVKSTEQYCLENKLTLWSY